MRLLITIDTEEDDAWSGRVPVTTENAAFAARFQELCDEYGQRPTWLCTAPVLEDGRLFEGLGGAVAEERAEIGAHFHPWAAGPFPPEAERRAVAQVYPHEIPLDDFRRGLSRITALARERFGVTAVSYRAGRWGFTGAHVPVLLEHGIRIDCSVTPHLSWQRYAGDPAGRGGPDFRGAPLRPYFIDPADVRREGESRLLELPMTVLAPRGPFASRPGAWPRLDRLAGSPWGRVLARLRWTPQLFRPWPGLRLDDLLRMCDLAQALGLPYLMLMFHSSELMPGGSPYYPDAASVDRLYAKLRGLFAALARERIAGATLAQFGLPIARAADAAAGRAPTWSGP